jgi:hypothetical protein
MEGDEPRSLLPRDDTRHPRSFGRTFRPEPPHLRAAVRELADSLQSAERTAVSRLPCPDNAKPLRRAGSKGFRGVIVIHQGYPATSYRIQGNNGRFSLLAARSIALLDDRASTRAAELNPLNKDHARVRSPAFQPIIVAAAFVFTETMSGMIEASATRSPAMPWTRSVGSTTASGPTPMRHVPTG